MRTLSGVLLVFVSCGLATLAAEPSDKPGLKPHFLSTNEPSFFSSDHLTGASFWRFEPSGRFQLIAREHMGIIPLHQGVWVQDTNGMVSLHYTNRANPSGRSERFEPKFYKDRVFLVWPDRSWAKDTQQVLQKIDSPDKRIHVYNEFQITGAEFTNATATSYPFKYHREMNKVTGAKSAGE